MKLYISRLELHLYIHVFGSFDTLDPPSTTKTKRTITEVGLRLTSGMEEIGCLVTHSVAMRWGREEEGFEDSMTSWRFNHCTQPRSRSLNEKLLYYPSLPYKTPCSWIGQGSNLHLMLNFTKLSKPKTHKSVMIWENLKIKFKKTILKEKISELELFWNVPVVSKMMLIRKRNRRHFKIYYLKNRHNTPSQLDLRKFCQYCHKHAIHGKIKK